MGEPFQEDDLSTSFRQSRREFWFMIGTWVAFALWVGGYNGIFADDGIGQSPETILGMPKWIVVGILGPWVMALAVTVWFALCYMQDTPLGEEHDSETEEGRP